MTTPPPEKEAPVTLRASTVLSMGRDQAQAAGTVPAAPAQAAAQEDSWLTMPALTAVSALAALLGTGWLLQRRQRLAQGPQRDAEPAPAQAGAPAPPAAAPVADRPPLDEMAEFAAQFQDEPGPLQPQQSFPAPLEHRKRASHLGVPSQKRLIKGLMWVRTVAGGVAILAAIAIVVFWAIETADIGAGDTGLTKPLLVLLLAAWAASWGAGQLANRLHRAFFGRVHPKFDK